MTAASLAVSYSGSVDLRQQIVGAYREVPCIESTRAFVADTVRSLHNNHPPHAKKPSEGAMAKKADPVTRTKADLEWLKDERAIAHEVRLALVSDTENLKAPRKELAKHSGCSHRTTEKWIDREVPTLPGLVPFLRMVPHSPA